MLCPIMVVMGKIITINDITAYQANPIGDCKGGILLIHEVWGLNDHIKDIANRFANEGYLVIAPNLLSELDIEAHLPPQLAEDMFNPEKRNQAQPLLRALMAPMQEPGFATKTADKVRQCFTWLYQEPVAEQRVSVVGFCFGGSYSYTLAVQEPLLKSAVPFYGHADFTLEELRAVSCPIMAFYGEEDKRLMSGLPAFKEIVHEADVDITFEVYGGCGHAFFNDTNPYAYNEAAANDAWPKVLRFIEENMNR
jgi:carboxymethylenebutenolidase